MPLLSALGIPGLYFAFVLLIALVFSGVFFTLLGIELRWRLPGVVFIILLVLGSALLGFLGKVWVDSIRIEGVRKQVKLENVSEKAGFDVFIPNAIPEGVKLREVSVLVSDDLKQATLNYSGDGEIIHITESLGEGDINEPEIGPFEDNPDGKQIKILGRPGYMIAQPGGITYLGVEVDDVTIQIDSSLGKTEVIKIIKSLRKQTKHDN